MKKQKAPNPACRPAARIFGPLDRKPKERIPLSSEELEALYLADFETRYHEDAAARLGVSRPTFAKILKRARKKMVEMMLFGRGIEVTASSMSFTLVFPTDDRVTVHPHFLVARYFAFATVEEGAISAICFKENPIHTELTARGTAVTDDDSAKGMAAGRLIPPLLKEAQIVVAKHLGEGMRRNIEGMGIAVEITENDHIDAVIAELTGTKES